MAAASETSQRVSTKTSLDLSALKVWLADFKSLELQRQIGEGSYGRVRPGACTMYA